MATWLERARTICSGVEHNEARIHWRGLAIVFPCHSVRMATKAVLLFEKVDLMLCVAKRIEGAQTRYAATDDSYALLLCRVGHGGLAQPCGEYTDRLGANANWMHKGDERTCEDKIQSSGNQES